MEALIIIAALATIVFGIWQAIKELSLKNEFHQELQEALLEFQLLGDLSFVPEIKPPRDYMPTTNERVLDLATLADDEGQLIVTDKAIVINSLRRNERHTFGSLSAVDIHRDGVALRRRKGPPRIVRCQASPRFLALVSSVLSIGQK